MTVQNTPLQKPSIEEILKRSPVLPVVTIEDAATAPDLARALVRGGIRSIEVTLRTPAALPAMEAIARSVPEIALGAGTVLSGADLKASAAAGATFAVSPGATPALFEAAASSPLAYLPAIATPSELMQGLAAGYQYFKFFPASAVGGIPLLKAFAGPFPQARFCPTGGISPDNLKSYLDLPNVLCAGGSWLTPQALVARRDWDGIQALAAAAARARSP